MLRQAGHDALTLHDQNMVGASDQQVAAVCREEERALVTFDLDFSDLRTYQPANYSGIVIFKARTQAKSAILKLVTRFLQLLETQPLQGCLWILQENGLRIRD